MKIKHAIGLALLAVLAGNAQASWDWFGGRLSLGGGYGVALPEDGPDGLSYGDTHDNGVAWTGNLKYFVNDNISIVAGYHDITTRQETSDAAIRFRPITGSVRANIFKGVPLSPYLVAGAGVSLSKIDVPGAEPIEWKKAAYHAGAGFEFFITPNASIGAEGLYHHLHAPGDEDPFSLVTLIGTVNFYFGDDPRTERLKQRADAAERRAEENATAAAAAQRAALNAQQQVQTTAEQQRIAAEAAAAAQAQAASADAARTAAEAQARQAQAELDDLQQMVARKELRPITFATGSANLLPGSNDSIDRVAEIAKKYPQLRLRVEGHTDNVGNDASNQRLSQGRADAVKNRLTAQGVAAEQVSAEGFGESRPMASNDNQDGRAQNRRVEFHLVLP